MLADEGREDGGELLGTAVYGYEGGPGRGRLASAESRPLSNPYGMKASYAYQEDKDLVGEINFTAAGGGLTSFMKFSRAYDALDRPLQARTTATAGTPILASRTSQYGTHLQKSRVTYEDNSRMDYAYDGKGQLTEATRRLTGNIDLAGQSHRYDYDQIGNRITAKRGGDVVNGALVVGSMQQWSYTMTTMNRYQTTTSPLAFDVLGKASATDTVTVNTAAVEQQAIPNGTDVYWRKKLGYPPLVGFQPVTTRVTPSGGTMTQYQNHYFLYGANQSFETDADGNLIFDGRWDITWDHENRVTEMTTPYWMDPTGTQGERKITYAYDWLGRRISKQVYQWLNNAWSVSRVELYVYDGWRLIYRYVNDVAAVADVPPFAQFFLWGTDLSGDMDSAGGVGGLLVIDTHRKSSAFLTEPPPVWNHLKSEAATHDGMGNVTY